MSLCQPLFARGRYKHEYILSALQQFYFLLIFYIETVHSFLHSLLKFYSKQKFVWFCYLVVFISTLLFCKQLPVLPGFVVKNDAVDYRSLQWEKSHEIVIKMLRVEKVGSLSERICGLKLVQIEPRSTHQKRGLFLDYQLTVLLVKVVRTKIPSQYRRSDVHVRIHVAPPSMLPIHQHKIGSMPFVALCSLFVPKIIKFRLCINFLQAKM